MRRRCELRGFSERGCTGTDVTRQEGADSGLQAAVGVSHLGKLLLDVVQVCRVWAFRGLCTAKFFKV